MYLKSLELHGFKSFPDKVKLTFDEGLTGVVGPNGSGKSNIGDAVRWVLGEQSTKTLRGSKMEDVIFSGTTARKAAGFASVTLTIDNSGRELSVDDNEVAVTRKIFRSGESEYKLNGKSVRLKDINELFMDTGLGRDGYSIIGQGRIAEIVGAKSTERRDIFEEAAGISKFRYKKAEAERKLSLAQENMNRLTDIVSELESRIEPLRKQSEKAEKFIVLADQKKQLEISLWIENLNELRTVAEKLSEDFLVLTAQYESIENQIENKEQSIQINYQKMREITLKIDDLKNAILKTEQDSSDYRSGIAVCENDISHSKHIIKSIKEKQSQEKFSENAVNEKIKSFEKKQSELKLEIINIKNKLLETEKNFHKTENEASEAEKKYSERENLISSLYLQQSQARFKIESIKGQDDEILRQISETEAQLLKFSETSEKYLSDIKKIENLLVSIECKENETDNKISGLSIVHTKKNKNFEEKRQSFEKMTFELKEKQHRSKMLIDLENSMEGFNYSVKEVMKASKTSRITGIYGTVAQLISVAQEYTTAIETALGGALQNIIVKNEDTAKRCIALLKELKKGRATFLPVTSIKSYDFNDGGVRSEDGFVAVADELINCDDDYRNIMSSLLGRTVVAEDIDYASVIAKKYSYKFRIVTLDGQVINAGGSFTGGSAVSSHGMLSRKNDINTLVSEISELEKNINSVKYETEKLKAETEKLRLEIEAENDKKKKFNEEKINLKSELKSITSIMQQSESQKNSLNENKKRLDKKLQLNAEQSKKTYEELESINSKINQAQSGIDLQQSIKDNLVSKRTKLSELIYNFKLSLMENEKNLESIKLEINHCENEAKNFKKNASQLSAQINENENLICVKRKEIDENRKILENLVLTTENNRKEISRLSVLHDEQEASITQMRAEVKEINDDKERVSREISRLDEKKLNNQRDYDAIISRLWEIYELTRSEAEKIAVVFESKIQAQKQLNEIKSSIKSLGNINVSAIEEYKEVSERYKFLSVQLKDVENSKKELEKLINDLTADMQRIFAENFSKINDNFKEIFVDLFGGGKADLELTDPDNILESGIEIKVAPPGKVIKNLISLSGGEQAFVAIAIYFAILRIKPAPFCILDEIDAALDEVNVRKYAFYLKKFTDTTQFILVTHRRGTMELANVLYGVTMQQNGVSKLLKMNQVDIPDEINQ